MPVTQPAAGADWSLVVPAGHVYTVRSIMALFATSAVVASRVPRLVFSDGVTDFLFVPPIGSQAASLTGRFSWFEHAGGQNVGNGQSVSIPTLTLPAGWAVKSNTTAIDAGDQWSAIFAHVTDMTTRQGPVSLEELAELDVVVLAAPAS